MHSEAGTMKLSFTPFLLLVPALGLSFQGCAITVPLCERSRECKLCKFVRDTITEVLMFLVSKSAIGQTYIGD